MAADPRYYVRYRRPSTSTVSESWRVQYRGYSKLDAYEAYYEIIKEFPHWEAEMTTSTTIFTTLHNHEAKEASE